MADREAGGGPKRLKQVKNTKVLWIIFTDLLNNLFQRLKTKEPERRSSGGSGIRGSEHILKHFLDATSGTIIVEGAVVR